MRKRKIISIRRYQNEKKYIIQKKDAFEWIAIIISFCALTVSLVALIKTIEGTKISNRPFIIVEPPTMYSFPDFVVNKEMNFSQVFFNVKNVGNTPAYNVHLKTSLEIYDSNFSSTPIFKNDNNKFSNTLVKGVDYQLEIYPNRNFSEKEVNDLISKKKYIYVYGILSYADIFDDTHSTKFCYRLVEIGFDGFRLYSNFNSAN